MHRLHRPTRLLPVALLSALLVTAAAACGDDEPTTATDPVASTASTTSTEPHPTAPGDAEEVDAPVVRLAVTAEDADRLVLVDRDHPAEVVELPLPAAATGAAATHDGRFLAVRHEDRVTVVDGGAWAEGHGDHDHHFATEPAVLGEVEGAHPSHLVSAEGRLALFFDDDGEAVVLDEGALADGELEEVDRVATAGPHHGFALAAGDGYLVTSPEGVPEGELPALVGVTGADGEPGETFPCPATHGEAHVAGGAAVACGDGVLLLADDGAAWTGETVAYPAVDDVDPYGDPAARAWSLAPTDEGDAVVAALGTRHLLHVDVAAGTASAHDLGVPVAEVTAVGDHAVALTTDGVLHVVDVAAGEVVAAVSVVAAFAVGEDVEGPTPQIAVHDGHAYVSDPATSAIVEVHLDDDEAAVEGTFALPVVPATLTVLGG